MKKAATPAKKSVSPSARISLLEFELASAKNQSSRVPVLEEEIKQLQALLAYRDRQLDGAGRALASQSEDRVNGSIGAQNAIWTRQREQMATTIRNLERECAEYKAKLMLAEDKLKVQVSPRESLRAFLRGILDED